MSKAFKSFAAVATAIGALGFGYLAFSADAPKHGVRRATSEVAAAFAGPDLTQPIPTIVTGSMGGDQFPARDAYLVTDHPPKSVTNGRTFDVFERPRYIFVALRVPRRDMPDDRCVLVSRWQSQGIGACYYRETFAVGTSDWMVVPVAMDNVGEQTVGARVEGGRKFLWPTPIGALPPMTYEELEHVR